MKGLINNVLQVAGAGVAIQFQQPCLVLTLSTICFVKLEDVRGIFLDVFKAEGLDVVKHVDGLTTPLSTVGGGCLV